MPPDLSPSADRLLSILTNEARGRRRAMAVRALADRLGLSPRDVQDLIAELIQEGTLAGSSCTPGPSGVFLIESEEDLEVGTRHIRSRALSSLKRVSALGKAAAQRFGPEVQTLFDFQEDDNAA
jgi:DNA-binding Lrp family transcriptional regulator